ncbi:MAG: TolC family protein [Proteobacteria bacterium]|jgi:outer membrane protein TolC|nr:TolC family protein [Pseudomonadota bacterium]
MTSLLVLLFSAQSAFSATEMTLDQFMKAASLQDPGYEAALKMEAGALRSQNAAALLTGLNFFTTYSDLHDGRPTTNTAAQGDTTKNQTLSIGMKQQSQIGLQWSLSQNYSHTKISNASLIPTSEYHDVYPKLELSLPLWRNFWGAEIRATQEQLDSQLQLQKLSARSQRIQKESEIKETFYNMYTQQRNYEIQKNSLERAEKILSWAQSRVARNLSDRSDLYQTEALVSSRKIELTIAEQKLKEAARKFNSMINHQGDVVPQNLRMPEVVKAQLEVNISKEAQRIDYKVLEQNLVASRNNYLAQKEKNKPLLDLSMTYSKAGRATNQSTAERNVWNQDKEYRLVALNFTMPLDIGNSADVRSGYQQLAESQSAAERARARDAELESKKTEDQAKALWSQWQLIRELEKIQKEKADLERSKYNNGRSTTYQVLTFEQDYANSRTQRISLELQLRRFVDSLELFVKE